MGPAPDPQQEVTTDNKVRLLVPVILLSIFSVSCGDRDPNFMTYQAKCREYAAWQCEGPSGGGPKCAANMTELCKRAGGPPEYHEGFYPSWEKRRAVPKEPPRESLQESLEPDDDGVIRPNWGK